MDPNNTNDSDILHRFIFFNVHKDGQVNLSWPPGDKIPPADDPVTGVKIKDVELSTNVSARMFLPPSATTATTATMAKFPVLLYIHGGGFCMQSAFSAEYTTTLIHLAAAGNILIVSVEYGLFPSRPIPACYDDSWTALQWIAAHANGSGPDPWLNHHADFTRLFTGGDSAGGNISHNLALRAGSGHELPCNVKLAGIILIHPFFNVDDKMWMYMCPDNEGPRDPRMCPPVEDLERIGCGRVLVLLADKDFLKGPGRRYAEELMKSEWKGTVEIVENKEKEHCFHVGNPHDDEALAIQEKIISFIYHDHDHDHQD